MDKIYNKLIRDKIPEIIKAAGEEPKTKILGQRNFIKELKKKILEEAKELQEAKGGSEVLNEITDIQELIDYLRKIYRISPAKLKKMQKDKNKKRGSFRKRLYLFGTNLKK